ncbi:MAG TPA: hypothetical protein VK607_05135 [Kofleriaceae bacterium]|nr:hypothetical protein [Kofleriaceae bacterium]
MSDVSKSIKEGVVAGLVAGVLFAIAQVVSVMVAGDLPMLAFRRSASVLLGPAALTTTPTASAIVVALIAHLYLSAIYGLCYGIYNSALSGLSRRSASRQTIIGPLYGAVLWLVNFQVFARALYPWLLALPQPSQLVLHAVGFGLPLGLLYATAEHRGHPIAPPLPVAIAQRPRRRAR